MSEEVNQPAESTPGLDQSEIDRLLTQQMAPPQQQVFQAVATRHFLAENLKIEPYDFRNPAFLTELELRRSDCCTRISSGTLGQGCRSFFAWSSG